MTAAALESETFAHAIEALLRTAAMVVESRAFAALLGATLRGSADLVASGEPLRATAAEFRAASIMAELGPGRSGPEGHARGRAGVGTPPAHDDLHPAPVLTLTRDAVFDAMRWASHTVVALPTAWGSHTLLQPVSPPNGACLHPGGSPTSLPSSPTPPGCTAGAAAPLPRPSTAWVLHRRLRRMAQKVLRSVEAGAAHPTVATAASQASQAVHVVAPEPVQPMLRGLGGSLQCAAGWVFQRAASLIDEPLEPGVPRHDKSPQQRDCASPGSRHAFAHCAPAARLHDSGLVAGGLDWRHAESRPRRAACQAAGPAVPPCPQDSHWASRELQLEWLQGIE